jgi:hypothetical protein
MSNTKHEDHSADAKLAIIQIVMHHADPEAVRILRDLDSFLKERIAQCVGVIESWDAPDVDPDSDLI